jgi:hypothetical protein
MFADGTKNPGTFNDLEIFNFLTFIVQKKACI